MIAGRAISVPTDGIAERVDQTEDRAPRRTPPTPDPASGAGARSSVPRNSSSSVTGRQHRDAQDHQRDLEPCAWSAICTTSCFASAPWTATRTPSGRATRAGGRRRRRTTAMSRDADGEPEVGTQAPQALLAGDDGELGDDRAVLRRGARTTGCTGLRRRSPPPRTAASAPTTPATHARTTSPIPQRTRGRVDGTGCTSGKLAGSDLALRGVGDGRQQACADPWRVGPGPLPAP